MKKKIVNSILIGDTELQFRSLVPSSYSIDITPNGHNSEYIAPADGWYVVSAYLNTTNINNIMNHTFGLKNKTTNITMTNFPHMSTTGGGWNSVSMPVKKGDDVQIWYYDQTVKSFKFVYALGQEPEGNSSNE